MWCAASTQTIGPEPGENAGCFCYNARFNITIDEDVSAAIVPLVLCHEIGHAVAWQYGLAGMEDEQFANGFGEALVSLIRDNPELVKFIRKGR